MYPFHWSKKEQFSAWNFFEGNRTISNRTISKSSFRLGTFFTKIIKLMEPNPCFDCRKGLDKWHETISKYSGRFYDVKLKGRRCVCWLMYEVWFSLGTYAFTTVTARTTPSKKWVYILLWHFAFTWNNPVCLSVLKLAPAVLVQVLWKTENFVISRCCFAEDGKEMYKE